MSYAREFKNDAASLAKTATDNVLDAAATAVDKAADTVENVKAAAGDAAAEAMKHGREAGRQIDAVAGNLKGAVDKSLREQPMATLAIAAVAGFVVGALWKS